MPLIRRLPKRGFNNAAFHTHYAIVNLDDLNAFKAGAVVNEQLLRESKLVRGHFAGIKILGNGELKHGLTIEADKVSSGARAKIEKAGGTVIPPRRDDRSAEKETVDVAPEAARTKAETAKRSTKKSSAKAKSPNQKAAKKA